MVARVARGRRLPCFGSGPPHTVAARLARRSVVSLLRARATSHGGRSLPSAGGGCPASGAGHLTRWSLASLGGPSDGRDGLNGLYGPGGRSAAPDAEGLPVVRLLSPLSSLLSPLSSLLSRFRRSLKREGEAPHLMRAAGPRFVSSSPLLLFYSSLATNTVQRSSPLGVSRSR